MLFPGSPNHTGSLCPARCHGCYDLSKLSFILEKFDWDMKTSLLLRWKQGNNTEVIRAVAQEVIGMRGQHETKSILLAPTLHPLFCSRMRNNSIGDNVLLLTNMHYGNQVGENSKIFFYLIIRLAYFDISLNNH